MASHVSTCMEHPCVNIYGTWNVNKMGWISVRRGGKEKKGKEGKKREKKEKRERRRRKGERKREKRKSVFRR